jgi:hypothetical protein
MPGVLAGQEFHPDRPVGKPKSSIWEGVKSLAGSVWDGVGGMSGAMQYAAPFFLAPNPTENLPVVIKTNYLSALDKGLDAL